MDSSRAKLVVSKWGNSLAVRLPAEAAKKIGVSEGDTLIAELSPDGRLTLQAEGKIVSKAEIRKLRAHLKQQKATPAVVTDMRRNARY